MKEKILELLDSEQYKPSTVEEIYAQLDLRTADDLRQLLINLNSLEDENIIYFTKKHKYMLISRGDFHVGNIDIKDKGFGFIKSADFETDLFVSSTDIGDAASNDEVLFRVIEDNPNKRLEAIVVKVLKRSLKFIVGELITHKNKYYLKNIDIKNKIIIGVNDISYAVVGDIVQVEIINYVSKDKAFGNVVKVVGNKNDIGIDIEAIAINNGFNLEFPDKVIEEVKNLNINLEEELKNRVDYRNDMIITIDGENAKDLDDAVHVEKLANGNYLLGVYIADVSFYVMENSALDKEAYERGTSVYLVNRVIPMLPHKLCNDLCSLNEHQPKLVLSCIMEINQSGEVVSSTINQGVIASNHRMTYTSCNKMLDGDEQEIRKYQDIYPMLLEMEQLSNILKAMRHRRGSLDFDIPESEIIVDETGKPLDVVLRTRGISEHIIEEFMLIANETVASTINHLELPFIYRIHDQASLQKLKDFSAILNLAGYKFKVRNKIYPNELQKILGDIKPDDGYLKTMILRMMAKAVYSEENIGHFGLASRCYTHFTSPIRRYPDLIVHRLLRKYLFNHQVKDVDIDSLMIKIADIAKHSSTKEREAIECEYQVDDMKKAEYMEGYVGQTCQGTISSVTNFGIFVSLNNTVEGLIRIGDLSDDYYEFIPSFKMLVGVRTKNKYRIGDKVKIIVASASKKMREINFKLVYNKDEKQERKYNKPRKNFRRRR